MGTRADFFLGVGPDATWIGSTSYDGYPDGWGRDPLAARTEGEFRESVERMLSTSTGTSTGTRTRPSEGWPWPWEDFRETDYTYAWDPTRNTAVVSKAGRAWVTSAQRAIDPGCVYQGEPLRDDEVPDMRAYPQGDVLGKSGLMLLLPDDER